MARSDASAAVSVERFFQFSLLGLVASGYLAVAGSGYLDNATVVLAGAGLLARALLIAGWIRLDLSERLVTIVTLSYMAFFVADYFLLSRDFLSATVHLVFFLAVMKILTARTNRDYLYTATIAFLELLAAAILSINFNFFLFLALFLLCAMATLTSAEIRRSMARTPAPPRTILKRFHPRLAVLAFSVTGGILVLTAGLFFILPRTADAALSRLAAHPIHLPGFSNEVMLGEIGEIKISSRTIMHVRIFSRETHAGLKWRGAALPEFDGKRWSNPNLTAETIVTEGGHAKLSSSGPVAAARHLGYHVELDVTDTDALFFAGIPETLDLRQPVVLRTSTSSFRLPQLPPPGFRYDAYSRLEDPPESSPPAGAATVMGLIDRQRYLQLPTKQLDPRIPELARAFAARASTDLARARAVERRLRSDYGYTLELPRQEVQDPLAYFLFTRKKGYCEYFASAMTVMLRTLGIPSRLVTGFQSGVYNPINELWVVRASDAHSWVEAWIPGYGWTTFDPTPPDPNPGFALLTRFGLYVDAAETFWRDWVVSYDVNRQGTLTDRMEQGARRVGIRWFDLLAGIRTEGLGKQAERFGPAAGLALLVAVGFLLLAPRLVRVLRIERRVRRVRRGRAGAGDATLLYQRMLRLMQRRGYQKPPWFTPAEFAASLPSHSLGPAVAEFTSTYNAWRFGGHTDLAPRLSALLDELERQPS
jgi:protein-glutamine gamma-glutamyltransferase